MPETEPKMMALTHQKFLIGLGPFLVGVISDSVFRSDAMLGWSLLMLLLPMALVGIAITSIGLSERAYQMRKPQLS